MSEQTVPAVRLKVVSVVQSDCFYPLYFILSYKRHCLPRPDEYLMGICCFICMLYNMGLYDHNSSREAAVPGTFSTRTSASLRERPRQACKYFHHFSPFYSYKQVPILPTHQCTNLYGAECFDHAVLNCAELFLNKHHRSLAAPLSQLFRV